MKNDLLFDFTIDKSIKTVFITRGFDADIESVWDAFTKAELLDLWIAPKHLHPLQFCKSFFHFFFPLLPGLKAVKTEVQ